MPRVPQRGDRALPGSRCCGAGCPRVSPRTDGGSPEMSCLTDGVRTAGLCGDPARYGRHWRCGERRDVASDGGRCLPRRLGSAAPQPPALLSMASSGVVVILLSPAKLAQRKGEPQIAPRFPKSLLLQFGRRVGCQGKAIKCRNNYARNSYEGSASIFE